MLTDVSCKAGQPPPWSFQPGILAARPALASQPALVGWPASRLAGQPAGLLRLGQRLLLLRLPPPPPLVLLLVLLRAPPLNFTNKNVGSVKGKLEV